MYGPSKEAWDALAFAAITGMITLLIAWLFIPPALLTAVTWMIVPRFNAEIEVLPFLMWSTFAWWAIHIAVIVLPWLATTWKRNH